MKKQLLILLILTLPVLVPLFQKGYLSMHDDLQSMRQMEMDKCFSDGQIPCRWVLDMGYGYGYPLFNYYPPLPYYLGQIFRWFGLSYIDVVKAVGITGFIVTALFMYLLSREFFGNKGGFIGSLLYTYAPYHAVDFYVRGAMNEFWAMAFYPAILWFSYRLIKYYPQPKYIIFLAISLSGLMLSHNPMLMIFSPIALVWSLFWLWRAKNIKPVIHLSISVIFALGLSAFFTLPVIFEQKFAHVETLVIGYFNYLAHFLDWRQIFININWGYGESVYGPNDTMSFALGYLQWIIPLIVMLSAIFISKVRKNFLLLHLLFIFTAGALFMTHFKATSIWQHIKPLEYLQFPWRFMTVAVLSASFLGAGLGLISKKIITTFAIALIMAFNFFYFQPREWYPDMTDAKKFSGKSWQLLVTSGIFDYLPKGAPQPPADPAGADINITRGQGTFTRIEKRTNLQKYSVDITGPNAVAELQTYYFPGWKIWVDGKEQAIDPSRDPLLGRMQVDLSSGHHELLARFTNTPLRAFGNYLSLLSWALLVFLLVLSKKSSTLSINNWGSNRHQS